MKISSSELRPLIKDIKDRLVERPANLRAIKSAMENLLRFLTAPTGRTDVNCRETDLVFCLHDEHGFYWDHLPEDMQLILDDMGMGLHDTITSPEIARSSESTPEQLLERVQRLK